MSRISRIATDRPQLHLTAAIALALFVTLASGCGDDHPQSAGQAGAPIHADAGADFASPTDASFASPLDASSASACHHSSECAVGQTCAAGGKYLDDISNCRNHLDDRDCNGDA